MTFEKTLYPKIIDNCLFIVDTASLLDSTFHAILSSESSLDHLHHVSSDSSVRITLKAGLDGSGSHNKRHQLSGDPVDDTVTGPSDSFLGVFMSPLTVHLDEMDSSILHGDNPSPNSIFFTKPTHHVKLKDSRVIVESIWILSI